MTDEAWHRGIWNCIAKLLDNLKNQFIPKVTLCHSFPALFHSDPIVQDEGVCYHDLDQVVKRSLSVANSLMRDTMATHELIGLVDPTHELILLLYHGWDCNIGNYVYVRIV